MLFESVCAIRSRKVGGVVVIDVCGNLDRATPGSLERELHRQGGKRVIVNLSAATKVGVRGLGDILALSASASRSGADLKFVCPSTNSVELIVLARLATCVELHTSQAGAMVAFSDEGTQWDARAGMTPPPAA